MMDWVSETTIRSRSTAQMWVVSWSPAPPATSRAVGYGGSLASNGQASPGMTSASARSVEISERRASANAFEASPRNGTGWNAGSSITASRSTKATLSDSISRWRNGAPSGSSAATSNPSSRLSAWSTVIPPVASGTVRIW